MVLSGLAAMLSHYTDAVNNTIPVAVLILLISALVENLTEPFNVRNIVQGQASHSK